MWYTREADIGGTSALRGRGESTRGQSVGGDFRAEAKAGEDFGGAEIRWGGEIGGVFKGG